MWKITHIGTITFQEWLDSGTSIPKEKWGVHEYHCCEKHWCKYGDEDCPVVLGLTKAHYPCDYCDYELEEAIPEAIKLLESWGYEVRSQD